MAEKARAGAKVKKESCEPPSRASQAVRPKPHVEPQASYWPGRSLAWQEVQTAGVKAHGLHAKL